MKLRSERTGAAAGVLFVLLLAAAAILGGSPPAADAPSPEVREYLADYRKELEAGVWLLGAGSAALLWWFGSLWVRMTEAERGAQGLAIVALTGLVLAGALALMSSVAWAVAAENSADATESGPLLYRLGAMLLGVEGVGLGVHLLAANGQPAAITDGRRASQRQPHGP